MSGGLEVLGWSLLHSVWQAGVVAAALWLVLRATSPGAARVRYAASLLALGWVLALPVLNYRATMELWSGHRSWVLATADGIVRAELAETGRAEVAAVREELRRRQAREWWPAAPAAGSPVREGARGFGLLWLLAAGLLATRLVLAQRHALGLAESGVPDGGWRRSAAAVSRRLGIDRPVRVRVTRRVDVPALVGWRWPVVLVPAGAAALSDDERQAVLAHELAHVRRGDYFANLVQSAAEALLFFSPAVWWISARIREERECCCDATAVSAVEGGAAGYVRALLSLETGRPPARAALALTDGPLLRRIRRIHGRAQGAATAGRLTAAAALALVVGTGVATAALTPDLVARRSAAPLMAADIEDVRFVVVRSTPAPLPAAARTPPGTCGGLPAGRA